jgi:eukaryotic-like serine/threonine-protein kinase
MTTGRLAPSVVLGRYELLAPVAHGGMAQVWAARLKGSRGFQKIVAIKTILPQLSDDAVFERMFLDEAALASRIRHPNVVEILDLGEQGDLLYLVMEWIDGETLAAILRKAARPVPVAIASRIVMQACAGLHAAHELRDDNGALVDLVHRDVSPQNMLVTREGAVKIVDFGIAKAVGRLAGETAVGNVKGKVAYMAPEQALGEALDRRVDVFALGVVYYFLLTGRHPFRTADETRTVRNVIAADVPPPRGICPELPEAIEAVVLRSLARDREGRFATMGEFELAIAEAMTTLRLTANDQAVKEYVVKTLGDRAAARKEWLAAAMRDIDERGRPTSRLPGAPSGEGAVTPPTDAATSVTAPTKEDTAAALGSDIRPAVVPRRRTAARLAVAGTGLLLAGVIGGVWLTRSAGREAAAITAAPSAPVLAPSNLAPPADAPSTSSSALEDVAPPEPTASSTAAPPPTASVAPATPTVRAGPRHVPSVTPSAKPVAPPPLPPAPTSTPSPFKEP